MYVCACVCARVCAQTTIISVMMKLAQGRKNERLHRVGQLNDAGERILTELWGGAFHTFMHFSFKAFFKP